MRLIVNADDFGLCPGVNHGIIMAHENGIVTSTTMMMNGYAIDEAVELATHYPKLGVGIHLVLTSGKPILTNHKTLTNEKGIFKSQHDLLNHFDLDSEEVYRELKAQIEKFIGLNLVPDHLDSHHHVQSFGDLGEVFLELSKEYRLPIRNKFKEPFSYGLIKFFDDFYADNVSVEYFTKSENKFFQYESVEIMTHPAIVDDDLLKLTSYNQNRNKELNVLVNKEVKKWIDVNQIELINYKQLK